jgi:hypothetical protein
MYVVAWHLCQNIYFIALIKNYVGNKPQQKQFIAKFPIYSLFNSRVFLSSANQGCQIFLGA